MRCTAVLVIAAAGLVVAAPRAFVGGQQARFSSRIDAVTVDTLVTMGGRPIEGLAAGDFEVFDNGALQRVTLVDTDEIPLNVVLALDASESVRGEPLNELRAASEALLDGLRPSDQCALMTFGRSLHLGAPLGTAMQSIRQAVREIQPAGGTPLRDAAYSALVLAESAVGRSLEIVFSDGTDTSSYLTHEEVLEVAQQTDAVVYAVAAGPERRDRFLRDLTDRTGGDVHEIRSPEGLRGLFARILDQFRHRYLLSFEPNSTTPGWHRIEVRVKGRRAQVKARAGYYAARKGA